MLHKDVNASSCLHLAASCCTCLCLLHEKHRYDLLLVCCILLCCCCLFVLERAAIIDSAIATVQEGFAQPATAQNGKEANSVKNKYRSFKRSSEKYQKIGEARARFEMMVELAEKKIIEKNRLAMGQDVKLLAESYAKELVHTPGTILTSEEIAQIYSTAGCIDYNDIDVTACEKHTVTSLIRQADGTCNNLIYPNYGAAGTEMRRLTPPFYEDSVSKPRGYYQMLNETYPLLVGDQFDKPCPTPRKISLKIVQEEGDDTDNDDDHTLILMQWGQFMDHDLDAMPEYLASSCGHVCDLSMQKLCLPFAIRENDMTVEKLAEHEFCHEFRRSIPTCGSYGGGVYSVDPREFFNSITHFIDGSTIYSHTEETLSILRGSQEKGQLLLEGNPPS